MLLSLSSSSSDSRSSSPEIALLRGLSNVCSILKPAWRVENRLRVEDGLEKVPAWRVENGLKVEDGLEKVPAWRTG